MSDAASCLMPRPDHRPTAVYGHFGRTEETFTWERMDKAEQLREAAIAL